MEGLAGILAVSSLGIPIVAIVAVFVSKIKKNNNDREIRRLIIENHTDTETAHYLIEEPEKEEGNNPSPALRWGCVLIGLGLGALVGYLIHLNPDGQQESTSGYCWLSVVDWDCSAHSSSNTN